ncbi:hypothetical protein LL912_12340 [Niabella sp. CC-SYL272]|uniref:hypothetical protein n=1 Tax=Niabella agricola TaxID=2891571 RepID=UPI001F2B88B7|nr:hypothetical protein [Niabella agricola]MCF3109561.1 hypothetical protein [Niabella agricola]
MKGLTMKSKLKKELSAFEQIKDELKKDSVLIHSTGFVYNDSIHSPLSLKQIAYLKNEGLLTDYNERPGKKDRSIPASIYVGGINCITFFVKQEIVGGEVHEHLLVYNRDAGNELSCISNLYSVTQDEEVTHMDIRVDKINGSMNYVTIKHDKITGL